MTRRLLLSEARGMVSVDDLILFKSIGDTLSWGDRYQKRYKSILQTNLTSIEKDSTVYQDIFKEEKVLEEMIFKVESIKFYLITKELQEYLPVLRLFSSQL